MKIPNKIIEKAILGGWKQTLKTAYDPSSKTIHNWEAIALDPTFWQALAKALGWEMYKTFNGTTDYTWKINAIRFCYHIYQKQSTKEFWQQLLDETTV